MYIISILSILHSAPQLQSHLKRLLIPHSMRRKYRRLLFFLSLRYNLMLVYPNTQMELGKQFIILTGELL